MIIVETCNCLLSIHKVCDHLLVLLSKWKVYELQQMCLWFKWQSAQLCARFHILSVSNVKLTAFTPENSMSRLLLCPTLFAAEDMFKSTAFIYRVVSKGFCLTAQIFVTQM